VESHPVGQKARQGYQEPAILSSKKVPKKEKNALKSWLDFLLIPFVAQR
jgi:hypothetical protein